MQNQLTDFESTIRSHNESRNFMSLNVGLTSQIQSSGSTATATNPSKVSKADDKKNKTRKRTTRACDQCNQLRTKCDGMQPCAHCQELKITCDYLRVPQKRGKASQTYLESASRKAAAEKIMKKQQQQQQPKKKDQSSQQSQDAQNQSQPQGQGQSQQSQYHESSPSTTFSHYQASYPTPTLRPFDDKQQQPQSNDNSNSNSNSNTNTPTFLDSSTADGQLDLNYNPMSRQRNGSSTSIPTMFQGLMDASPPHMFDNQPPQWFEHSTNGAEGPERGGTTTPSGGAQPPPPHPPPPPPHHSHASTGNHNHHNHNHHLHLGHGHGHSHHAPPTTAPLSTTPHNSDDLYRTLPVTNSPSFYPQPPSLLLGGSYGSPSSVTPPTSANHHHTGSDKLTKATIHTRYPVLLPIIDALVDANISIRLAEDLLETYFAQPAHVLAYLVRRISVLSETIPRKTSPALLFAMLLVAAHDSDNPVITGTPSSRLAIIGKLTDLTISYLPTARSPTANGSLDEVIAYIQLGTIVSASEFKGSSLRWWGIAIALAKELKLNQENPHLDPECREEQRRTWWLLYMVDRHLGLCYNRPLIILDSESTDLFIPDSELVWQSDAAVIAPEGDAKRQRGVCHVVTGQGIYGYFLPLMSILGMLVDIHHAEQHPLLPMKEMCGELRNKVRFLLDQYATSLKNWNIVPQQHAYSNAWKDYALQLVHVFYILYSVSWDPIELLTSEDLMSNPNLSTVTNHAVLAAKAIRRILSVDPDLKLIPFFFGVYLLQGSFILLAIVDRLEADASPEVIAACETIVHAHEVCIVTLNTEYQRNFRRVMRNTMSLLASQRPSVVQNQQSSANNNSSSSAQPNNSSVNNSSPGSNSSFIATHEEREETKRRRQDVIGLYRWIPGGHGLAV